MKIENEIIVRCKQPIKIEKLLQCLLPFSHTVGGRNVLQTDFVAIFLYGLYFLNALQSDNNLSFSNNNLSFSKFAVYYS